MDKLFTLLLITSLSVSAAEEECVFDTVKQQDFTRNYISKHADSILSDDGYTIQIARGKELISFSRGGCVHFGINLDITIKDRKNISEKEFFSLVLAYHEEFGTELVKTEELASAVHNKSYTKTLVPNGAYYFVAIPSVASYEISLQSSGDNTNINIGFYIN